MSLRQTTTDQWPLDPNVEFTPAWRNTGLPMKPSHLELDHGRMSIARLVDPKTIMGQYQELKTKEVLKPPHIWEYNDKAISPHYTKTTYNLEVRMRLRREVHDNFPPSRKFL